MNDNKKEEAMRIDKDLESLLIEVLNYMDKHYPKDLIGRTDENFIDYTDSEGRLRKIRTERTEAGYGSEVRITIMTPNQ